jgi:ABC-type antimicrobial peptide transport system permease subunit
VQQKDAYAEAWQQYRTATQIRLNGRRIVTMTVLVLSMVMLALLQRTQIRERIGMVAVYRLLGIPGYQLAIIYGLECILLSARSILPAAALTWLVVAVLTRFPSLALSLQLPWQAALLGAAAIVGFYLLVSLIPLWRILQKPPARLAGQYDL